MIVADASIVATALLSAAPDGDRCRQRMQSDRVAAPELLDLEVLSVLRNEVLAGRLHPRRGAHAISDLTALPIRRTSHGNLLARVWELRNSLTSYDASYVALAELLDAKLITSDLPPARSPGPRCEIETLA